MFIKIMLGIASFIIVAILLCLALIPNVMELGYKTDKMLHIFVFTHLILIARIIFPTRPLYVIAIPCLMLGVALEGVQALIPDRNAEWADMAANIGGFIIGWLIIVLIKPTMLIQHFKKRATSNKQQ